MNIPDLINGSFELFGALFVIINIKQLYKDKEIKGIHWLPTLYFTAWGLWNCYFYPHLGQWFSFVGGLSIAATNFIWLGLLLYYFYKRKV